MARKKVSLITQGPYVVILNNGLVKLTILKPQGFLTGIQYGKMDNLLDLKSSESSRGYWDINWSLPGGQDRYTLVKGGEYSVIHASNEHAEVSFRSVYDPPTPGIKLPLSIDIRYILMRGVSGFHCYAIYERPPGCRAFDLAQTRMVFKLRREKFVSGSLIPAKNAYVGLSAATTAGSWQIESKGYQFWVQTDSHGNFTIKNVIPGVYGLHGWVPGFIGDYLDKQLITISPGSQTQLGNLIFVPARDGPTVWKIGFPDRTANNFYVPDVNPMYVNKLFLHSPEKYRQYGLWDRYTDLHPEFDQVFSIGISDLRKDWFFAHVDRRGADKYLPSTWAIKFNLISVTSGIYKLRLAIASANRSDLKVHVNYMDTDHLVFQVLNLGTDNTVCRHSIHGLYRFFSINLSSSLLIKGDNSIFLTQARGGDALCGVLYDYLRLEAPPTSPNQPFE